MTKSELSLKDQVFKLLKKNPTLTAKPLCKLLELDYDDYKSYVSNLRQQWRDSLRFGLGSKAHPKPTFHNARAWVYVNGLNLKREDAILKGWILSKNRNRTLIWKDPLGRMEWFETDRVNLYIKAPALKGRVFQLFSNGFSMTGLITSMTILGKILESIRLKSAHAVFDTGQKLPYMVIDLFKLSNGMIIKSGDKTHPTSLEIHFAYPDWGEKNERLLAEINKILHPEKKPERLDEDDKKRFYIA